MHESYKVIWVVVNNVITDKVLQPVMCYYGNGKFVITVAECFFTVWCITTTA